MFISGDSIDTIVDFDVFQDLIDIADWKLTNFGELMIQAIEPNSFIYDVRVSYGENAIVLENIASIDAELIASSNFII